MKPPPKEADVSARVLALANKIEAIKQGVRSIMDERKKAKGGVR